MAAGPQVNADPGNGTGLQHSNAKLWHFSAAIRI
jgi:hypothetical protein